MKVGTSLRPAFDRILEFGGPLRFRAYDRGATLTCLGTKFAPDSTELDRRRVEIVLVLDHEGRIFWARASSFEEA